jgi:hypothetical protein
MPLRVILAMSTDFKDNLGSCIIELKDWQAVKARKKNKTMINLTTFITCSFL